MRFLKNRRGNVGFPRRVRLRCGGRSRIRWLLFLMLAMAAVIGLAPTVISRTGLRNRLVGMAISDYPGTITIGRARAGWFSPVVVEDLAISDADGQPLAEVARIHTSKNLLALATDPGHIGKIVVHSPRLQIVLANSTSNLEQAIKAIVASRQRQEQAGGSTSVAGALEITDGLIGVLDRDTGQSWRVSDLHLAADLPANLAQPVTAQLKAKTRGAAAGERPLDCQLTWHRPSQLSPRDLGRGELYLMAGGFPLPVLQPLVRRGQSGMELAGTLEAHIQGTWSQQDEAPMGTVGGSISLVDLDLGAHQWLGPDHVVTRHTKADLGLTITGGGVDIRQCQVVSDLGSLAVSGRLPLAELMAPNMAELALAAETAYQLEVDGRLDIGRLVAMLPNTLRLREGTQMTGGQLQVACASQSGGGARVFTATVASQDLSAVNNGQVVTWEEPLRIELRAHADTAGFAIDELACTSDFIELNVVGRVESGRLEGNANLAALGEKLVQFVDLGKLALAGECRADMAWKRSDGNLADARGTLVLANFLMDAPGWQHPWREQELTIVGEAQGALTRQEVARVDAGNVTVRAGDDQLVLTLSGAVEQPSAGSSWPVECQLRGNLVRWLDRLRPWMTLPDYRVSGDIDATTLVIASSESVAVRQLNAELRDLRIDGPSLHLLEPIVRVDGQGQWNLQQQQLRAPELTLTSSTLALRAGQLDVQFAPGGLAAKGSMAYRADLQRLLAMTRDPQPPASSQTRGQLNGNLQMTSRGGVSKFLARATVQDFGFDTTRDATPPSIETAAAHVPRWTTVWMEPQLSLEAHGQFDQGQDVLTLDQLRLAGDAMQWMAAGQLRGATHDPIVELTGSLTYDWDGILRKVGPIVGDQVRISGRHSYPFAIQGPLTTADVNVDAQRVAMVGNPVPLGAAGTAARPVVSDDLTADATLGWAAAELYGLNMGPQQVAAHLHRGVLAFQPLQIPLNEGRVMLAPRVHLNAHPMTFLLEPGTVVDQLRISPELCRTWLQYVAPLVANASNADGTFSVAIGGAQVPVAHPQASSVDGQLTVHAAQVSPGPLAQQLLGMVEPFSALLDQRLSAAGQYLQPKRSWLQLKPQAIDFQMAEGRVFHRGLEVTTGDVTIRTQGWVTLDQQMSLIAEIPVHDDWIKKEKLLASLRGQTIQIPITGSIQQPQLDGSAVTQLTQQMVRGAASSLIQDEMQKQLKKLFGK